MDPVLFTPLTHMLGCLKCSRPCKGHPLPYDTNCAPALAEEHTDESRDIPAWGVEGPLVPTWPGPSALGKFPAVDNAAPVLAEHHIKPKDRATQQKTTSLITTVTTITTGAPTKCSLEVLSTRLGQQDEQSAKDRCQTDELSQQLSDTTTQLAHISKVLDHLLTSHTPMATLVDAPAAPSTSAGNGTVLWEQHHLSHNKALPPARSISLPAVSKSMGRQPHTAMQRFDRIKQVLPRHRSTIMP